MSHDSIYKQTSAKCRSGIISTLIKLPLIIDIGCLWCALKPLTKNILGKPDDSRGGKRMCKLINKAGYRCWRIGNSVMQSLTLKHLLVLYTLASLPFSEGFERDVFFRPFPHANLKDRVFRTTANTKMGLFDQVTLCLGFW